MRITIAAGLAALLSPCIAAAGDFHGAYAGASFHLRNADEDAYQRNWWASPNKFRIDQPAVGAFIGYNHQMGDFILGGEFSSSSDLYGRTLSKSSGGYERLPPYVESWMWSSVPINTGSGTRFERTGERDISITNRSETTMKEVISPMVSGRLGVSAGDFLFYGRGGVGFSQVRISSTYTDNRTVCTDTISRIDFTPNTQQNTVISCVEPEMRTSSSQVSDSTLAATYAAALGVEYNFERIFARVEAEARRIQWGDGFLPGGDSGSTRHQVNFGLGVRF